MGKIFGIVAAFVMVVGLGGLATPTSLALFDDPVVTFPDPNLEAAIRNALDEPAGDIHQSDLERLTSLEATYRGISDLTGMEHCTDLLYLYLTDNSITDVSPLANLANLTVLGLGSNQISDISSLSSLQNLRELSLGDNQISDISALSSLADLYSLRLRGNQISDISALSSLASLWELDLFDNQISDVSALVDNIGLGQGDHVDLRDNHLDLTTGSRAMNDIQTLRDRGVRVDYEAQKVVLTPHDPNDIQLGVKAGDWIKMKYTITGWPAGQPRPVWLKLEFLSVEGTSATVLFTMGMSDGTEQSDTVSLNVLVGHAALGLSGVVIPANSAVGDFIIMGGFGVIPSRVAIEGETTRTYAGARRRVVYVSDSQYGVQATSYWDKLTGVMVGGTSTYTDHFHSIKATAKVTETNMWKADPIWMRWWLWTIVAVVVVALAGAVYLKKRKMRSGVSP